MVIHTKSTVLCAHQQPHPALLGACGRVPLLPEVLLVSRTLCSHTTVCWISMLFKISQKVVFVVNNGQILYFNMNCWEMKLSETSGTRSRISNMVCKHRHICMFSCKIHLQHKNKKINQFVSHVSEQPKDCSAKNTNAKSERAVLHEDYVFSVSQHAEQPLST